MLSDNCSVQALIIENGKNVKGTLTLFVDGYVFNGNNTFINWNETVCEQGTAKVKTLIFSSEKPYIIFSNDNINSIKFFIEKQDINKITNAVSNFKEILANKKAEEDKLRQIAEGQKNEKEKSDTPSEKDPENRQNEIQVKKENEKRILSEKRTRLENEVEKSKNKIENKLIPVKPVFQKASSAFLDNPYRILGISCLATNEDANTALDKLKKLARLKALEAYCSPFDIAGLQKPIRDLSIAQNALTLLKDMSNKFFWFAEADACIAWQNGKYRIELSRDGEEYGTYDLFLANYVYAIICDPDFNVSETWKRILKFYCYICNDCDFKLLRSRFNEKELQNTSNADILNSFKSVIFKPILQLCDRNDLDAVIRLYRYIEDCSNVMLENLSRNVSSKLVSWFTDKEADLLSYLKPFGEKDELSGSEGKDIYKRGEAYCSIVEPVLEMVLRDFKGDTVKYNMIKESYHDAAYQVMYELNKCSDKSDAIIFANKCYAYCSVDEKRRIQNTFGKVNIKSIDWSIPNTIWDAKGDDYYYGRGHKVDYAQALYWYHKAADDGNKYSMNSIGICYQKGKGVPQNDEQAAFWFKKAADSENPQGAYNLAECFFAGIGVKKDIDSALEYWAEAAKLGHPSAAKRREPVFMETKLKRKKQRAQNHICHDIGFQMTTGPRLKVEVTLNHAANVYLVNRQGYKNYLEGNDFSFRGGYAETSPYYVKIPSSNHWYVIVDNGDKSISEIRSDVKVRNS